MKRTISRGLGIVFLLMAFTLLYNSMVYTPIPPPIPQEEGPGFSLAVASKASNGTSLITVRARILNARPPLELPIANAVVRLYIPGTNDSLSELTGRDGSVSFRVSPGRYIVGISYLGIASNATIDVPSRSWLLVDMKFIRVEARPFTMQLQDFEKTGIVSEEGSILAHFYADAERPLVAELLNSAVPYARGRIALFWIEEYKKEGASFWAKLKPLWPLVLEEIERPSELSFALYWLNIEVSKVL